MKETETEGGRRGRGEGKEKGRERRKKRGREEGRTQDFRYCFSDMLNCHSFRLET